MDARHVLADIVRSEVGRVDAATPLRLVPGMDSLAMVNLVVKIETTIGRQLTEDELDRLVTVGDVQKLLGHA